LRIQVFSKPNPWMIFSHIESLCMTHSNLKNIYFVVVTNTENMAIFPKKTRFWHQKCVFCTSRHLCL
jgi:hypothetical protein